MYDITMRVREYPGCWGVSAAVSDVNEWGGRTVVMVAPERLLVLDEPAQDPLAEFYRVLVMWCRLAD